MQGDQRLQRQVSGIRDALPYIDRIWVTDAEGRVRLSTQSFPPPDARGAAPPLPPDRSPRVGVSEDDPEAADSFTITRRLDGPDGKPRGMVSAIVQASYFHDYWSRLNLPPHTRITLYRLDDGRVLARAPAGPAAGPETVPTAFRASPAVREGSFRGRLDGDVRRMGAFHRVGDLPLVVQLTLPASTVTVIWLDRARPYLIFAVFAAIGLALVGIMAFHYVRGEARDRRTLEGEVRRRTADLATLNALGRSLATQSSRDAVGDAVIEAGRGLTGAVDGTLVPADDAVPDGPDWIVAPLGSRQGGLHGHLALRRPGASFDERHRAIVDSLASQAAASLDNAALHESAEREIESRKRTETQQQWLIRELHHRVKNTLATVQAVMGATARASGSMEDFQAAFTGRLASLANTHSLLTEALWQRAPLRQLLRKELSPYDGVDGRIALEGPDVDLPSDMAVPLGMAMHEMATNAAKYGALSVPEGRVSVTWSEVGGVLHLEWAESGGPPVRPSNRTGFGSKLIDRVLRVQLQAELEFEREEPGVRLRARIPIPQEDPRRVPMR